MTPGFKERSQEGVGNYWVSMPYMGNAVYQANDVARAPLTFYGGVKIIKQQKPFGSKIIKLVC